MTSKTTIFRFGWNTIKGLVMLHIEVKKSCLKLRRKNVFYKVECLKYKKLQWLFNIPFGNIFFYADKMDFFWVVTDTTSKTFLKTKIQNFIKLFFLLFHNIYIWKYTMQEKQLTRKGFKEKKMWLLYNGTCIVKITRIPNLITFSNPV